MSSFLLKNGQLGNYQLERFTTIVYGISYTVYDIRYIINRIVPYELYHVNNLRFKS